MDLSKLNKILTPNPIVAEFKKEPKEYEVEGRYKFKEEGRTKRDILGDIRSIPGVVSVDYEIDDPDDTQQKYELGDMSVTISNTLQGEADREELLGGIVKQINEVPGVVYYRVKMEDILYSIGK